MKKELIVSVVQSDIRWENIDDNLVYHYSLIKNNLNCDLVVLPEMFTTGFSLHTGKLAETMDEKTVKWMVQTAQQLKTAIVASFIVSENEKYYNRMLFVTPDGNIQFYDKRHLFRMGNENKYYNAGKQKVIVNYLGWRIRLLVCYDLRFPVWCRNVNDYDVAIYIANWPDRRAEAWKTLLSARAIENQTFVIGVNRCGIDGMNLNYSGDSRVIGPGGEIISATKPYAEDVITTVLTFDFLTEFRNQFPAYLDSDSFRIID